MKRALVLLLVAVAIGSARRAEATVFTLDSLSVQLTTSDPGLVLWDADFLKTPTSFNLNTVGQSFDTKLFRVGTKEDALNLDDLFPHAISVNFGFSKPDPGPSGTAAGISGAAWLGQNFGYVVWDNPLVLAFGTTGLLGITLSNETFGLPGYADVDARFQLLRADVGKIPEPASLILCGALMAGAAVRRRYRNA